MTVRNAQWWAYIYVFLAALLWAASGTVAKFLFSGGMHPFQLVQLRTTTAATALCVWLFLRKREYLRVERHDLPYFIFLGVSLAIAQSTYLYAISRIQVAAAILLQYLSPVLITAYAVFVSRRLPTGSTVFSVLGALVGCYFMVGGYRIGADSMNSSGIISGLCSAAAFAVYTVRGEYAMRSYSPWTVLFYALVPAAIFWNIFHPPLQAFVRSYSLTESLLIGYVGIFGTVIPFGLYNEGILRIRAVHASITATLEPVFAGIIAYGFLGEGMELSQVMGGVLVILSVVFLQMRKAGA